MRILFLTSSFWPSDRGEDRLLLKLAQRLVQEDHEISVFTPNAYDLASFWRHPRIIDEKKETYGGILISRFPIKPFLGNTVPSGLQKALLKCLNYFPSAFLKHHFFPSPYVPDLVRALSAKNHTDFDLVITGHLPYTSILSYATNFANHHHIPLVAFPAIKTGEPRSRDVINLYTLIYQVQLLKKAQKVMAQTDLEKGLLVKKGIRSSKIDVIPNGLDLAQYTSSSTPGIFDFDYILHIGHKSYNKGTFHLIKAMRTLWKKGLQTKLVFIGTKIPRFDHHLTALSAREKSRILDLGPVDERTKNRAIQYCQALVLPSRAEGFGVSILEAWAYQKPVVTCFAGGIPSLVKHNHDGVLVKLGDVPRLAKSIKGILSNEKLAQKMGQNGHRKLCKNYQQEPIDQKLLSIFESVKIY